MLSTPLFQGTDVKLIERKNRDAETSLMAEILSNIQKNAQNRKKSAICY